MTTLSISRLIIHIQIAFIHTSFEKIFQFVCEKQFENFLREIQMLNYIDFNVTSKNC